MRILLVEDEVRLAQNVAAVLREIPRFAVDCASDGQMGASLASNRFYVLIGLAICRAITNKAKGTIEIQSKPGSGTTAVVRLRLERNSTGWTPTGTTSEQISSNENVTVIDTTQRTVISTILLPGKPEFPTVDGTGTVFVNIEDKNEIVRLDAGTNTVTATWQLTDCDSPSGMAIDVAG